MLKTWTDSLILPALDSNYRTRYKHFSEPVEILDLGEQTILNLIPMDTEIDNEICFILYQSVIPEPISRREKVLLRNNSTHLQGLTVLTHVGKLDQLFFDLRISYLVEQYSNRQISV